KLLFYPRVSARRVFDMRAETPNDGVIDMYDQFGRRSAALVLMGLLTFFAPSAAFAETPATPTKVVTVEGITEYRLDNGLRVLLFPDSSAANVTVNLTVLVGSRHEGYGETGMAHLLEHMLFKGTPKHREIPRALKEHG